MARQKDFKVRTVTKNEERRRPSVFHRLKDGEKMVAYALFEPDSELKDNPGWYEYFAHWDGGRTVPCVGEDCLLCEDGNNPSTKALTVWYLPDEAEAQRLKIFTANVGVVDDLVDEAEDLNGILGRKYRIKRRGSDTKTRYKVVNLNDKMKKSEVKSILKSMDIDLPAIVEKQAKAEYERIKATRALEEDDDLEETDVDDDDDDDEETPKARKGEKVESDDDDSDSDDDDDDDDDDSDSDDDDDSDSDDDDSSDDDDEVTELESRKVKIKKVNEEEETITVTDEEGDLGTFDLWQPENMELDLDDFSKGDVLTVNAVKDDEGDWVMTDEPEKKAKAKDSKKDKKKGSKKK